MARAAGGLLDVLMALTAVLIALGTALPLRDAGDEATPRKERALPLELIGEWTGEVGGAFREAGDR